MQIVLLATFYQFYRSYLRISRGEKIVKALVSLCIVLISQFISPSKIAKVQKTIRYTKEFLLFKTISSENPFLKRKIIGYFLYCHLSFSEFGSIDIKFAHAKKSLSLRLFKAFVRTNF